MSKILLLYSENMVLSPKLWTNWNKETQETYTLYANLEGPQAYVYVRGRAVGIALRNAARHAKLPL